MGVEDKLSECADKLDAAETTGQYGEAAGLFDEETADHEEQLGN